MKRPTQQQQQLKSPQQQGAPQELLGCVAIGKLGKGEVTEAERISEENKHLYQKAMMRVEEVTRKHEEIQLLCEQALKRADAMERLLEEAEARTDASERKAEQASARAYASERRAEQASTRAETAERRAEQASTRAETAERTAEQAIARAEQASTRAETAERHATDLEETLTRRIASLELSFQDIQFDPHALPFWAVQREEIQMTNEEIGRGGWGAIKVALFKGQRVAAKTLHNQIISPHNLRLFMREMNMAARVRHPQLAAVHWCHH